MTPTYIAHVQERGVNVFSNGKILMHKSCDIIEFG